MKWEDYARAGEQILCSPQVPSSLDIITLIKRINPTTQTLSQKKRELGYRLKNRLQSLLLEHYGDTFYLVPHPACPTIMLIKHRCLPSVDACHADLGALSREAIERVETAVPPHSEKKELKPRKERPQTAAALSPKEALKKAQELLEEYDYPAAEEVLAGLRAQDETDLPVIARGAGILLHEIGAYQRCIDTLLAQPKHILDVREIRGMLAVAYHHNGFFPEARAILDQLHPADLSLEALFAYADIAFKDGNFSAAWELVSVGGEKEGFLSDLEILRKDIEAAMSIQAEPVVQKALVAFEAAAMEEAGRLVREALDLYPNCQKAREILSAIEATREKEQLAKLWARLENEPGVDRRIALLRRLFERDNERRDTIRNLLIEEKKQHRRMLFDEQLESLRSLVLRERWPECFDALALLMRQPDYPERAGEVLSLSPFFSVLHENRRVHVAADRSLKELWLRFVRTKVALSAGDREGCFESLEALKPWFGSCPLFRKDYDEVLQHEQEKARKEILLLVQQCESSGLSLNEVRHLHACVKKRMPVLPVEARRDLVRSMEERIARMIPQEDPVQPLEEYREALKIGNSERAAHLRQEVTDPAARDAVEAEVAEAFHIDLEPVTLEVSDDLAIDLTTPPPLDLGFFAGHRLFLMDGDDTYVMIDFAAKAACRISSPVFAKTAPCDSTDRNSFLFVEENGDMCGDMVWRAEITVDQAAFTASFDMRQRFDIADGFSVADISLSTERDTEYYVLIQHDEGRHPAKFLKKRVAPKCTVETLQMGNRTELKLWRSMSYPDMFIIGGDGEMRHVNRNLSLLARLSVTPDILKIDRRNGFVYGMEECKLTQRSRNFQLIKSFDRGRALALWESRRVHGFSVETGTALFVLGDGQQAFYNFNNNTFSNKIRVGRVIPSQEDGKWYCFDYSRNERKLWLRDITEAIHTELEWREFFRAGRKWKSVKKGLMWFTDENNFIYRPDEWEGPFAASGAQTELDLPDGF